MPCTATTVVVGARGGGRAGAAGGSQRAAADEDGSSLLVRDILMGRAARQSERLTGEAIMAPLTARPQNNHNAHQELNQGRAGGANRAEPGAGRGGAVCWQCWWRLLAGNVPPKVVV